MIRLRIRARRDTPFTGRFDWAVQDERGAVLDSGSSTLERAAVRGDCELVLAADLVRLERIDTPSFRARKHPAALRFLVEEYVASDPEQLHVAAETGHRSDGALAVAIVDRPWFSQLLAGLERTGIVPRCAFPELLLPAPLPRTWTTVLDGTTSFVRLPGPEAFVLDEARAGEPPAALRLALESARAAQRIPERILVRTARGIALPDIERWTAELGIRVEPGDPWNWANERNKPEIDLLQGEFAPRAAIGKRLRRLRRSAVLAAALAVLYVGGVVLDWVAKASERRRLIAEMNAIYRETFGEGVPIVDAPLQMRRALDDLRRQAGHATPSDFLALLATVAERLPDPHEQRVETMTYENGVLSLVVRLRDPAQREAFSQRLLREGAAAAETRLSVEPRGPGNDGLVVIKAQAAYQR